MLYVMYIQMIPWEILKLSQDFQSLENSDSEATSWPEELEETLDRFPDYDIYEENEAQAQ